LASTYQALDRHISISGVRSGTCRRMVVLKRRADHGWRLWQGDHVAQIAAQLAVRRKGASSRAGGGDIPVSRMCGRASPGQQLSSLQRRFRIRYVR
jgi:hypothetical protein